MTDPSAVVAGLFTNTAFGVPLLVLSVVALLWILSRFNHLPPLFRPIGPDRSWMMGPYARVEQGASSGRMAPAVAYASHRVHEVLRTRYGIRTVPSGPIWMGQQRFPAQTLPLIRLSRSLDATYRLAWLAERDEPLDFLSRWRRPKWRREARERFSAALTELERILPPLEAAA